VLTASHKPVHSAAALETSSYANVSLSYHLWSEYIVNSVAEIAADHVILGTHAGSTVYRPRVHCRRNDCGIIDLLQQIERHSKGDNCLHFNGTFMAYPVHTSRVLLSISGPLAKLALALERVRLLAHSIINLRTGSRRFVPNAASSHWIYQLPDKTASYPDWKEISVPFSR